MKKIILMLIISIVLLTGCKENNKTMDMDKEKVQSVTEETINLVNEEKYDKLVEDLFDEDLKKEADISKIKKGIEEKTSKLGRFKKLAEFETFEKTKDESSVYLVGQKVIYEEGVVSYTIGLNEQYKIIAFYIND